MTSEPRENEYTSSVLGRTLNRRRLLRNAVLLGSGGIVSASLLAACGEDDDEDVDDEEEPEAPQIVDEPTPTPEPEEDPDDDVADDVETDPDPTPEPDDTDVEPEDDEEPEAPDDEVEPADDQPERPQSDQFAYGFNIAWRSDEEGQDFNEMTRDLVDSAGFNWVRVQIHWSSVQREPEWLDPLPLDRLVETFEGSGIRMFVSVVGAPDWARDPADNQLLADWNTFAEFMAFMADRYRGRIHAWGIWNEQNMAHEMHGTVRVSDYAYLLEAGHRGVKEADPDALVVYGGLTPTGVYDPAIAINDVDYLREFYAFEGGRFAEFFDLFGLHLNATNNPPDTSYPDNPGPGEWTDHNSFYFLRGVDQREVMAEFGDERPGWVTEFGWTTENQAPGYEYGAEISEEDQARFLVDAFSVARERMPWIIGMFVWNLNFSTLVPPEDEKYPWSVVYEDWSPRPAYTALRQMPKP